MPEELDLTEIPQKYTTSIHKVKDEDEKKLDLLQQECFMGTIDLRRKDLEYREWYMGIDKGWQKLVNEDGALDLPMLVSMMIFHHTEIQTFKFFNQFFSDSGSFGRFVAKKESAREAVPRLTRLFNNYIVENGNHAVELYRICRAASRSGIAFSSVYWDLRHSVDRIPNVPTPKFNLETKIWEDVPTIVTVTKEIANRPVFEYVDWLFCGMPPGTRMLNEDGKTFIRKKFFYRAELEELEEQGYIGDKAGGKSFGSLKKDEIGDLHTNNLEPAEVKSYFQDMFDTRVNEILGFDHPHYKFCIDEVWQAANYKNKVTCMWSVNGHIIRKAEWEGGFRIPYEQHNLTIMDNSYVGMGIPEIDQDYFREDNVLMNISLDAARREGSSLIFMNQELLKRYGEHEVKKFHKSGRIVGLSPKDRDVALSQQIVPVTLASGSLQALSQIKAELRQQARQYSNINIVESGAGAPSSLRSEGVVQAFTAESSGPDKGRISLFAQSISNLYEQIKSLIYYLEPGPVEVSANSEGTDFFTVNRQDINKLSEGYIKPETQVQPVNAAMANVLTQLAQLAQPIAGPVDPRKAINYGELMDILFEKALNPEEYGRLQASKGTSPTVPQLTNNSIGLPPQA